MTSRPAAPLSRLRIGEAALFAALLCVLAAACQAGGDDGSRAKPSQPTSSAGPAVTGIAPAITSGVSTEGGGAKSAVEVRVEQILTQLDAKARAEGTVITLDERVLFAFDRAEIKPGAASTLAQIAEVVKFHAAAPVSIRGHTDSVGSDAYNDDLSRRRAEAVRNHLVDGHRIDGGRLEAVGFGKRQPVTANTGPGEPTTPKDEHATAAWK